MKTNKLFRLGGSAVLVAALVALGGCDGGGGGGFAAAPAAPAASTTVPDSAGASGASFVAFIMGLISDETSEPLTFNATFPATPEDNTGDPVPLA